MKRRYEAPIIEKIAFVSNERVCGVMDGFDELLAVAVASQEGGFTKNSIFEWEEMEKAGQ